jgi:DNA helicase II / ATP-dependent DNA helicase PcrA
LVEFIERVLRDLRLEHFLEEAHPDDYEARWENVKELVALANEFVKEQGIVDEALPEIEGMSQAQDDDILARFLANISLASDKQMEDQEVEKKPHITISTIHAAKGLEWPVVFVPAVYKGSIPHARSEDDAEERRLLFVAMTRAQALLYLSSPQYSMNGQGESLQLCPFIGSVSQSCFLKRGPVFQRQTLEELAAIVGRQLPSEESIYEKLPPMTAVEDDLFPVDPNEVKQRRHAGPTQNHGFKRQKTGHTGLASMLDVEQVEGWSVPYQTTMQKSASFTLPGFTTAGAQHAITSAERAPVAPSNMKHGRHRPSGQRNLLTYFIENHDQSRIDSHPEDTPVSQPKPGQLEMLRRQRGVKHDFSSSHTVSSFKRSHIEQELPLLQPTNSIDPELRKHKLGATKSLSKPRQAASETRHQAEKTQYSQFSSSPSKAPTEAGCNEAETPAPEIPDRPAACFHATTMSRPPGSMQSLRKPIGLGRAGIAPMDRLRRPFKPLSINRQ